MRDPGSNSALGKQRSRVDPINVPAAATPTLPDANLSMMGSTERLAPWSVGSRDSLSQALRVTRRPSLTHTGGGSRHHLGRLSFRKQGLLETRKEASRTSAGADVTNSCYQETTNRFPKKKGMTRDVNMLLMLELALGIQQLMDIFGSASELPVILSVDASLYSQQPVRLPASGSSSASLIHPFESGKAQFLVPLPRLRVLQ